MARPTVASLVARIEALERHNAILTARLAAVEARPFALPGISPQLPMPPYQPWQRPETGWPLPGTIWGGTIITSSYPSADTQPVCSTRN